MTIHAPLNLTEQDRAAIANICGRASIREFTREVCAEAGIDPRVVLGPSRIADICRVRDVIWFRAHEAGYSLARIGRVFKRDHTTVLSGIKNERKRRAAQ